MKIWWLVVEDEELDIDNFEKEYEKRKRQKLEGTLTSYTPTALGWEICEVDNNPGLGLLHGQVPNLDLPKQLDDLFETTKKKITIKNNFIGLDDEEDIKDEDEIEEKRKDEEGAEGEGEEGEEEGEGGVVTGGRMSETLKKELQQQVMLMFKL